MSRERTSNSRSLAFLLSLIRPDWHIVQIGANDHVVSYGHDPVPSLVRAGLRTTLYEPIEELAANCGRCIAPTRTSPCTIGS